MNSIEVKNVSKHYQDFSLRDVSFFVPQGSIMGLIGENGAGKTTLIKLILNMIRRDSGTIELFGKDNVTCEQEVKAQIGVVLDKTCFNDTLKAKDVKAIMRGVFGARWDDALFDRYMEEFSVPRQKKIKEFSRGMSMKLSIAVALAHRPKLLILDEATSGLDPIIRSEILDVFLDFIQDESHSILISSHITSDLEKVADYITFIHDGRVALSEPTDKLRYEYGVLKCGQEIFDALDGSDVAGYRKTSFGYEVLVRDAEAIARRFEGAVMDSAALEDIMLYTVRGEQK